MKICPHVEERCCTLVDQIAIIKLWKNHGQVSTRLYSDSLYASLGILVKYLDFVSDQLDESDITVHYAKHKWIPYLKNYCFHKSILRKVPDNIQKQRTIASLPGKGRLKPFRKDLYVSEIFEKPFEVEADRVGVEYYLGMLAESVFKN